MFDRLRGAQVAQSPFGDRAALGRGEGLGGLRPMRGLQTDRTAQVIIVGHAFVQNLRRGHYELALDTPPATRLAAVFNQLAQSI